MDAGKGAAAGPLLLDAGGARWFTEHSALCNKYNVTVGEFLLKLPSKPAKAINSKNRI